MNKILIKNNKSALLDLSDNPEILSKIRTLLSFKQEGVEFSIAYKQGWNGITCLLGKNNKLPLGLLKKVAKFLDENSILYEIEDKREKFQCLNPMNIAARLKHLGWEPRDYQIKCADISTKNSNGIFRSATGSGKTLIAGLIIARHNTPTIVYVPALDLLDQFHKSLTSMFGETIGRIGGGECDIQRINVATIQTVGRALDIKGQIFDDEELNEKEAFHIENKMAILQALKDSKLHIIDECHSATNATIKAIWKHIDPVKIFGLSGTPFRNVGSDLVIESILGPQIANITAGELIKRGILAQPFIKFINVPAASITSRTYADVYREYIVENDMRNNIILNYTKKLMAKGYSPLVLFRTIKHGDILFKLLSSNGIRCALLSGKDSLDKRNGVKESYNKGELDCIIASSIFEIGIDLPKLNSYINASGQKSYVKVLQKMGRVIRSYPGKKTAVIVEFIDNCRFLNKHSKIRHEIYSLEEGLIISYPNETYMKGK